MPFAPLFIFDLEQFIMKSLNGFTLGLGAVVLVSAFSVLGGCADMSRQERGTATGAVIGGATGAVLSGGSVGGAAAGAVVGGVIGHEATERR